MGRDPPRLAPSAFAVPLESKAKRAQGVGVRPGGEQDGLASGLALQAASLPQSGSAMKKAPQDKPDGACSGFRRRVQVSGSMATNLRLCGPFFSKRTRPSVRAKMV